jgi:hypothetical protein
MLATVLLLSACALLVSAQDVINVTVGVEGSFFVPPTVSARKGDMINFIFGGEYVFRFYFPLSFSYVPIQYTYSYSELVRQTL